MEADKVEKHLNTADNALTKIKQILKKHWGVLLLLLCGYIVYWSFTQPDVVQVPVVYDTVYVDTTYYYEDDSLYTK